MIATRDATIVLQGPVDAVGRLNARVATMRAALPGATVVLSTWLGTVTAGIDADRIVLSADPGALPPSKLVRGAPNNVNRQIVSSAAGLATVTTPWAIKLRSDALLTGRGALDWLARIHDHDHDHHRHRGTTDRIVTTGRFTLDPRGFETMPFHLSDWFQLGATRCLQQLWSGPLMTVEDATHYDRHAHTAGSTLFDRRIRARWPAEQHVWRAYASQLGLCVPRFHNDCAPSVLADHDHFLATGIVLLDASQAGLQLPALDWAASSGMQRFNCLDHLDWLALAEGRHGWRLDAQQQRAITRRGRAKALVQRGFRSAGPLMPALAPPPLKRLVSVALKCADHWARIPVPPDGVAADIGLPPSTATSTKRVTR